MIRKVNDPSSLHYTLSDTTITLTLNPYGGRQVSFYSLNNSIDRQAITTYEDINDQLPDFPDYAAQQPPVEPQFDTLNILDTANANLTRNYSFISTLIIDSEYVGLSRAVIVNDLLALSETINTNQDSNPRVKSYFGFNDTYAVNISTNTFNSDLLSLATVSSSLVTLYKSDLYLLSDKLATNRYTDAYASLGYYDALSLTTIKEATELLELTASAQLFRAITLTSWLALDTSASVDLRAWITAKDLLLILDASIEEVILSSAQPTKIKGMLVALAHLNRVFFVTIPLCGNSHKYMCLDDGIYEMVSDDTAGNKLLLNISSLISDKVKRLDKMICTALPNSVKLKFDNSEYIVNECRQKYTFPKGYRFNNLSIVMSNIKNTFKHLDLLIFEESRLPKR